MARAARSLGAALVTALAAAALVVLLGGPAGIPRARAADPALSARPGAAAAGPGADGSVVPDVHWHGSRTERIVALTFDDGWSPRALRTIYRTLVREEVPATFFVTGIYVQRDPDLWRRIAAAGFPLANHSYLHRDARSLSEYQGDRDLALTRAAVERVTGVGMAPLYRPPYGARNRATDRRAAEAGFPHVVMWDVTAADTSRRPSVASVVRSATTGRSGSIVLLHAGPKVTPRALPRIIASYRSRGYRFVTVPELLGIPFEPTRVGAGAPDRGDRIHEPPVAAGPPAGAPGSPASSPATPPARPPAAVGVPGTEEAPVASPPPARDAAWARQEETPMRLAGFTLAALAVLLAVAVLAGRGRGPDEAPPA